MSTKCLKENKLAVNQEDKITLFNSNGCFSGVFINNPTVPTPSTSKSAAESLFVHLITFKLLILNFEKISLILVKCSLATESTIKVKYWFFNR